MQKIGQSRAEKALREHLTPVIFDSPPPTPKSVRPPLSPLVEAELRAACSYILQNFRPSHIVYQEKYGYAAVQDPDSPGTVAPARAADRNSRSKEVAAADDEEHEEPPISAKYRYKPNVATADLFKDEDDDLKHMLRQAKARPERAVSAEPSRSEASMQRLSGLCLRSPSQPTQSSQVSPKVDSAEQPNVAPGTGPTKSTGSTPQTDATEEPWSEKASTAMTSMPITPARSKRTSSHAHSGSEASSMPQVDAVDASWMREQLEKHKKSQEEQQQRYEAREDKKSESVKTEVAQTRLSAPPRSPAGVKCPKRKPVPIRSASTEDIENGKGENRQDSKVSIDQSLSQKSQGTEGYASGGITDKSDHIESHVSKGSDQARARPPSRARSITRQVKEYIRPASAQRPSGADEVSRQSSRASSRAANTSWNVKDYFRPATGVSSRKTSLDATVRTSRSIDSFRTAVSDIDPPSATSAGGNWKSWKSFHRKDGSQGPGVSRPTTSDSSTEPRGSAASRDMGQTPLQGQNSKPPVNLNRELPPLPSLDQWKPEAPEYEPHPRSTEVVFQERPNPLGSHKPSIDLLAAASAQRTAQFTTVAQIDPKKSRRKSRSIQLRYSPEYHEHAQASVKLQATSEENISVGKAHVVNCARVPPGTTISRTSSKIGKPTPTTTAGPPSHRRSTSDHHHQPPNFSRKVSMDDQNTARSMQEARLLPNLAEISVTPRPLPTLGPAKEQRKWWQRKMKKVAGRDWMDEVAKSGAHGGVLLTDDVAAAPIVRY